MDMRLKIDSEGCRNLDELYCILTMHPICKSLLNNKLLIVFIQNICKEYFIETRFYLQMSPVTCNNVMMLKKLFGISVLG